MLAETTVNQSKTDRLVALRNVIYGNSTENPVTNRALKTDHGQDNYAVICNIVSAASLKTAVEDPRTKYPSQKDVWGGISASEVDMSPKAFHFRCSLVYLLSLIL